MKNFKTLQLLIPMAVICIILQGFTSNNLKRITTNMYDRVFSEDTVMLPNEKEHTKLKQEYLYFIASKNHIVYADPIGKKGYTPNFLLTFLDPNTLNVDAVHEIIIQDRSNIVYTSSEKVYYRHKLDFYQYDLQSEHFDKLNNESTTIFNFSLLNEQTAICIGNIKNLTTQKNSYGFFTYDLIKKEVIRVVKTLDDQTNFAPVENSLKYVGKFVESGGKMIYTFDMYGKVIAFDKSGNVEREITTIDKVSPPGITHITNMYTYKRGSTFYSNAASLINDQYLYVFSCRPNNTKHIIVDKYNLESGGYVESYKLNYQDKKSTDINYIFQNGKEEFVIGFSNFFQGFDAKFDSCED